MPEDNRHEVPIFGVLLLFFGVVFLLQTLNILQWGLWLVLWRFWPVLLIIIGLALLLHRWNPWLVSALILILLLACLGIAVTQYQGTPLPQVSDYYAQALDSKWESSQIQIRVNAGELDIRSLSDNSTSLIEAVTEQGKIDVQFTTEGKEAQVTLGQATPSNVADKWQVGLNPAIPLRLLAKVAAGNFNGDLQNLKIDIFNFQVDVGNAKIALPSTGSSRLSVDSNVARVEIIIPDGVSAHIRAKNDLGTTQVDESRFPKQTDYFESPDYQSATNKVDIQIRGALSRVLVH